VLHQEPISRGKLAAAVKGFRENLLQDPIGTLPPVDLDTGHELYSHLLAPLRSELAGIKHLIIVPDDVLVPLPFAALVTNNEGEAYRVLAERSSRYQKNLPGPRVFATDDSELAGYAKVSWLARDYGITELPSATSLRLLRGLPHARKQPSEKFLGIGNPSHLAGSRTASGKEVEVRGAFGDLSGSGVWRLCPGRRPSCVRLPTR
jgi:CHAT domain-containing protein